MFMFSTWEKYILLALMFAALLSFVMYNIDFYIFSEEWKRMPQNSYKWWGATGFLIFAKKSFTGEAEFYRQRAVHRLKQFFLSMILLFAFSLVFRLLG